MSKQKSTPANPTTKVSTSISINRKLLSMLRKEARSAKRSVSAQLEMIIEEALSARAA